jgi:type IV pilus assembly protein PilC
MSTIWYQTPDSPDLQHLPAPSLTAALLQLKSRGTRLTKAGLAGPSGHAAGSVRWARLIPIYEQLGGLLARGVTLAEALSLLASRTRHRRLRYSLQRLAADVSGGLPLSDAMARQPQLYSQFAISTVAAGEAAGDLASVFAELAAQQRELHLMVSRLKPLVIYPLLLLTIMLLDLTFVFTFILPKFVMLFKELGMTDDHFPITTLVLMRLAPVMWPSFLMMLLLIAALVIGYRFFGRFMRGNLVLELGRLHIPVFGPMTMLIALGNAASALCLLLRRHVNSAEAVRLAGAASGNGVLETAFARAAVDVREGSGIADAVRKRAPRLPEDFLSGLATAEASGDLTGALARMAEDYPRRVHQAASLYPYLLGPIVIILLGLLLMFTVFGMFAPLLAIIGELSS